MTKTSIEAQRAGKISFHDQTNKTKERALKDYANSNKLKVPAAKLPFNGDQEQFNHVQEQIQISSSNIASGSENIDHQNINILLPFRAEQTIDDNWSDVAHSRDIEYFKTRFPISSLDPDESINLETFVKSKILLRPETSKKSLAIMKPIELCEELSHFGVMDLEKVVHCGMTGWFIVHDYHLHLFELSSRTLEIFKWMKQYLRDD